MENEIAESWEVAVAKWRNLGGGLGLVVALSGVEARAQGFRWPEEPQNLKVLPANFKDAELGRTM